MSHNVFANNWAIAGKAGMNKSIARFPDVCMSPPSPPAGPIPIPYPDTSFSTDLQSGTTTVKVGGQPAALAQKSFYKSSPLGDEAATRSFGASVITHQITGKTYFQAWSMDVKFEGKNVCRHIDLTTSNHGSAPPGTPPAPTAETQTFADAIAAVAAGKCPCCGKDLHAWQMDDAGAPFTPIKESEFWQKRVDAIADPKIKANRQSTLDRMKAAKAKSRASAAAGAPGCPNVHPDEEKGCAVYFDIPKGSKSTYKSPRGSPPRSLTPAQTAKRHMEDGDKDAAVAAWEAAQPGQKFKGVKMDHKTPSMAGGCNNPYNMSPKTVTTDKECKDIEAWQSGFENEFGG
jgi:uncharacterized Zn-binding protein involved in type VI secretion